MAPKIFDQLYVIRAPLGDLAVTCVYALLSGKSQAIYEEMFRGMEAKCEELGFNLDPSTVMADFEIVSIYYLLLLLKCLYLSIYYYCHYYIDY